MTTLVQVLKTLRTRLAAAGLLAAGAALVAAAQDASGTGATLVDCSTSDLQTAIDNAPPGATLAVSGMCLGSYTIGKNLTLVGRGPAVLDGQQAGTVLTISSGATVGLSQMTITDGNGNGTGFAGDGGGIENSGTLTVS
jgi:nitrous oxidase accessory protein NosD